MLTVCLAAIPLLVCQPAAPIASSDSCLTMVAGLDTSCGNNLASMRLGASLAQTFDAISREIRRITVWRPAVDDTNRFGLHLFVLATDSLRGAPDPDKVILDGPVVRVPFGDGVHPVRMDFNLDPPLLLPSLGTYAIAFQATPCWAAYMALLGVEQPGGDYPGGIFWATYETWPYCVLGRYTAYPDADLIFEIEFCASTVCAEAAEGQVATLQCPTGHVVSSIDFASFGTPTGSCGTMAAGACDSPPARAVVESACLGQPGCTVAADPALFGDPCPGTPKQLFIQASIHPRGPDLVVPSVAIAPETGSPAAIRYVVKNTTSFPAGPSTTAIKLSQGPTIQASDPVIWSKRDQGLAGGDSIVVDATVTLPPEPRGHVTLAVIANAGRDVDEQVEVNDTTAVSFTYAAPRITSIADVPADQGGRVALHWLASPNEVTGTGTPIRAYEIERRDAAHPLWQQVGLVPASGSPGYDFVAPTAADSTARGPFYSWFVVRALTADLSLFFDSPSDSGQSVNNLTVCAEAGEGQIATLQCRDGYVVSSIDFASYGTPTGDCSLMTAGTCAAPLSRQVVENACLGQPNCTVAASSAIFGDPCPGTPKRLAIRASIHPLGPDLKFTHIDVPQKSGTPLTVSYTVANRTNFAAGPFKTTIRLSADAMIDQQDSLVWSKTEPGLGPQDSVVVSAALTLPLEPRGNVYLGFYVDADNQVDEEIEGNNKLVVPLTYDSPRILSVQDVPNDQGGKVVVSFLPSPDDRPGVPGSILSYEVHRWAQSDGTWRFAARALPHGLTEYSLETPTATDSTPGTNWRAWFLVRATTSDSTIYFDSAWESGYSVDNLAPGPPTSFAADYLPRGVRLHWAKSPERDLSGYRLYRLQPPDYTPSRSAQIAATADTAFTDSTNDVSSKYALSAVDIHGNEGAIAIAGFVGTLHFELFGVTPNPVQRGPATVAFMLQTSQPVHVEVMDLAGRRLDRQEVGHLGPGFHAVTLGRDVRPGLYFVRLIREDATGAQDIQSKKFVVLE